MLTEVSAMTPMWVDYFKQAGIEQTPENGFGATPLTKYRRHVLMLHPHTVIVYDELEAFGGCPLGVAVA